MKATFRKTKIEPFSTCEFSVKGMKGIAAKGQTSRCRKIELHQTGIILHPEDETLKAGRAPSADGVARLCGYSNWAQMRNDLVTDDKSVKGHLIEWGALDFNDVTPEYDDIKKQSKPKGFAKWLGR